MYVQQNSCPVCAEFAVQGRERDVQLLGLFPVAVVRALNTPQRMHGLLLSVMDREWQLLF